MIQFPRYSLENAPVLPLSIKMGLLDAHEKLSEYYFKYDESPFYTWAACAS
jgi:hypothetical protein